MATTYADAAAKTVLATAGREPGPHRSGSIVFLFVLWFSLFFGVVVLVALIVSTAIEGAPRFDTELLTNYSSTLHPETTGFRAGILGSIWLMLATAALAVPLGIAAALHLEEFANRDRWWNRLIEINLQNLAAVPSVVYGLLAVAFVAVIGIRRAGSGHLRSHRTLAPDPPGHHHHHARGGPCGTSRDPRRLAGSGCHPVADDLAADPAGGCPRHRYGHDPRSLPGHRRGGAAAHDRYGDGYPLRPERPDEPVHCAAVGDLLN